MAIEINSKKRSSNVPQWVDKVLYIGVIIFIIAAAAAAYIFWVNREADKEKERTTSLIEEAEVELELRSELEEEILRYAHLVGDFKSVESSRKLASSFFDPFQKAIHPQVEVYTANVSLVDGLINFNGIAKDMVVVGEQFGALKNIEYISDVQLSSVAVVDAEGKKHVSFALTMQINMDLFKDIYGSEEIIDIVEEEEIVNNEEE